MPEPRSPDRTLSAFVGQAVAAETVFEAAAKRGFKSVAVHYPAASPARTELESTVDGFGHPGYGTSPFQVTPSLGYTNVRGIPSSYLIELSEAEDWLNLPTSNRRPLEFSVPIITKRVGEDVDLVGLVIDA